MILKNLMEEKQLDFDQPLLSVRRISSTVASENENKRKPDKAVPKRPPLPFYKSDLKSGPVSNPGTVPFVWEKTPGKPKNESRLQTQAPERASVAPKLPPGRVLKADQQDFDKVPKVTLVTQSSTERSVSDSEHAASLDNQVTKHESPKEVTEKASSCSDNEDETYLDALDTLSRTESFFMSCSVSGLSEWDDHEVQPSGSFPTDQEARDFMIDRFLPAAKAMASETPSLQHHSRKPLAALEQPKLMRKVVTGTNSRPLNEKWQKVLPHYVQDIGREESGDESDDNDGYENYAPKVCGLFPRFCLLNPVPGLRTEGRIQSSTGHGVQNKSIVSHRRTAKENGRTANNGKMSLNSQSGFTKEKKDFGTAEKSEHGIDPPRRACSKSSTSESSQFESSSESPVVEKTLYVDSVHEVKSSNACSSDTNDRGDDFDTSRKDTGLDKNLCIDYSIEESKHLGIVDEKGVLQPKSSASLDSSLLVDADNSNDNLQMELKNHPKKICPEEPNYQGNNLDHALVAFSSPAMVESKKRESESKVFSIKEGSNGPGSWRNKKFTSDLKFDPKGLSATKVFDQECTLRSSEDPSTLTSSKVVGDTKLYMKLGHGETLNASSMKHPLALPSPKAPSESWLKRTLPTVSSKNTFLRSKLATHLPAPVQIPSTALSDPKWERIVKSSKANHGHLQFGEELLPTIPEA
ncbi:uncharacterized protein LOC114169381 isoform X2 [Vigna unguiculata]|nr:uncharacterized protein LOC114169381 isoform X2 [Vigna unguiculata]XP_027910322.1 uncharacterized protein LOC114169381 isoform X2 [Vigna unguiculata]XP_027910323.1 uncharacterized protein LOC114169381 isoform X2 [Vigna unguiculata]